MTQPITSSHPSQPAPPAATLGRTPVAPTEHDKLVATARKWVAQTFFGTLLKQARSSAFHSKLFEGGRGGEAFGSLYDQQMADHLARGVGSKLVESIARKIEAGADGVKTVRASRAQQKAAYEKNSTLLRRVNATTAART